MARREEQARRKELARREELAREAFARDAVQPKREAAAREAVRIYVPTFEQMPSH